MFNKILQKQKTKLEGEINDINLQIQNKTNELNKLNNILSNIQNNINITQKQLIKYKMELDVLDNIITIQNIGIDYQPTFNELNEITNEKIKIQNAISKLIKQDKVILTTRIYRIDGSEKKGEQFQKIFCENLLIGFNSYYNAKKKTTNSNNLSQIENLICKKFNTLNNKASLVGVSINTKYLDLCLNLLHIELDERIAKAEERERIKEERRRLREQEKLLAEAEKAKLELQKQRRMYEQSLAKALNEQERQEFEAKLKEIDKREADVDYRINNSKAGYLYITATKAMPNMTKLGVTRRLNPLVRIQELSSAATPYPFVCYGLVFSDNAFDLETRIHEYFDSKRVNTENKHKEFFYITPHEAIKVLKEEFGCDVHFVNEEESEDEDETN